MARKRIDEERRFTVRRPPPRPPVITSSPRDGYAKGAEPPTKARKEEFYNSQYGDTGAAWQNRIAHMDKSVQWGATADAMAARRKKKVEIQRKKTY